MLESIAALSSPSERDRRLFNVAVYLSSDALKDILAGRGAIGAKNCAQILAEQMRSGKYDPELEPVIKNIEQRAVIRALNAINANGRINPNKPFAGDLKLGLANLSVAELIRLKLVSLAEDLLSVFLK